MLNVLIINIPTKKNNMSTLKFHHIGFLTKNINKSFEDFKHLKYKKLGKLVYDANFKVKIQFIQNNHNIIELIEPYKSNYGLIYTLKIKNYAYHFAYKVKNINKEIKRLKKKYDLVIDPTPALAFGKKEVSFLKMKNGFIIELIQN